MTKTKVPRLRKYSSDACVEADCECFTEGEMPPTRCTMQCIPNWKEARE